MNFNFAVSIPKNTSSVAPYEETLKIAKGVITHLIILIPTGHAGKAHLRLFYHEVQLYPLNRNGSYSGNNVQIEFDEYQPLLVEPFELKVKGWNLSTDFSHAFYINVTLLRPEELESEIPQTSLAAMYEMFNEEEESDE